MAREQWEEYRDKLGLFDTAGRKQAKEQIVIIQQVLVDTRPAYNEVMKRIEAYVSNHPTKENGFTQSVDY